jgi:hypothetical protein
MGKCVAALVLLLLVAVLAGPRHNIRSHRKVSPGARGWTDEQIPGPDSPSDFPNWLAGLRTWRTTTIAQNNYTGMIYNVSEVKWTQNSWIQAQMHPYDRFFFDGKQYTVDKYLDDVRRRYGGVDSILIWPTCAYTHAACTWKVLR